MRRSFLVALALLATPALVCAETLPTPPTLDSTVQAYEVEVRVTERVRGKNKLLTSAATTVRQDGVAVPVNVIKESAYVGRDEVIDGVRVLTPGVVNEGVTFTFTAMEGPGPVMNMTYGYKKIKDIQKFEAAGASIGLPQTEVYSATSALRLGKQQLRMGAHKVSVTVRKVETNTVAYNF